MTTDIGITKLTIGKFMKISPQDNAKAVIDNNQIDKAISDRARINREVQAKTVLDDEVKKSKIEQNKFMHEQFQKLVDGIYHEKAQQNSFKIKGTNVDKEV
jgi:hypothetical protein